MKITEEQEVAERYGVKGPMDRIRQKRKGERAYTNDEIARFESLRAELRAWDDIENIERGERAVAVLRGAERKGAREMSDKIIPNPEGIWERYLEVTEDYSRITPQGAIAFAFDALGPFMASAAPAQGARVPKVRTSHGRNKEEAARLQELVNMKYDAANVAQSSDGGRDPRANIVGAGSEDAKQPGPSEAFRELADWLLHMQGLNQTLSHIPEMAQHIANLKVWETLVRRHTPVAEGHHSPPQPIAASVVEALEAGLRNMLGAYDTPVSRRRFPPDDFMKEATQSARDALAALTAARDTEGK